MKARGYTKSEVSRLNDIIGSNQQVRLVAHVSNGPWYGFNGVQELILTDQAMYRVQASRYALRPDVVLDKFLLDDVAHVKWKPLGRSSGRISFDVAGKRKSYASKWTEASDLAKDLIEKGK